MLAKTNQKNKPWTEEDNAWAIKQHDLRRTNYYIAKKLGRTEVAVQVHLSKMRTKVKEFTLGPVREPMVMVSSVNPVALKTKRKINKKAPEPVQSEWVTLFTGLAGGVFGAVIMHFIW